MQSASFCGSDVFHRRDFCRRQVVKLIDEAVNLDFEGGYVGIWAGAFGSGSRVQLLFLPQKTKAIRGNEPPFEPVTGNMEQATSGALVGLACL